METATKMEKAINQANEIFFCITEVHNMHDYDVIVCVGKTARCQPIKARSFVNLEVDALTSGQKIQVLIKKVLPDGKGCDPVGLDFWFEKKDDEIRLYYQHGELRYHQDSPEYRINPGILFPMKYDGIGIVIVGTIDVGGCGILNA